MPAASRSTRQRRAVEALFAKSERPLTVADVHRSAKRSVPGIGIATIYRAINAMVEDGSLDAVEVAGQAPRYERRGKGHHHHFQCTTCERTYDLAKCGLALASFAPPGFRVRDHSLTLYGACAACSR